MPFGSTLANFEEIDLRTADGRRFVIQNGLLSKLAFRIIGLPHIEARVRAGRIFSFLPAQGNNKKILDAGCGPGIMSLTLQKKGFDVAGIDIDKEKINFLKKNGKNLKVSVENLTNLSFKDHQFDFVVCSDVIEHIKDDKEAIKEISRVLKKGGILALTVPSCSEQNKKNWKRYGHKRIGYKIDDLETLAKANSLKITKIKPYSGIIVEKAFELNEKMYRNKALLGLFFYPLYLLSFLEDLFGLNKKHYNGLACQMTKF